MDPRTSTMKDSKHRVVLNSKWPIRANITMTIFDRLSNFALSLKRVTHFSAGNFRGCHSNLLLGTNVQAPHLFSEKERKLAGRGLDHLDGEMQLVERVERSGFIRHPGLTVDVWNQNPNSKSL